MLRIPRQVASSAIAVLVLAAVPTVVSADHIFEKVSKDLDYDANIYVICEEVKHECRRCGEFDGDWYAEAEYVIDRIEDELDESRRIKVSFHNYDEDLTGASRSDRKYIEDMIMDEGGTHVLYVRVTSKYFNVDYTTDYRTGSRYFKCYSRTTKKYRLRLVDLRTGESERYDGGIGRLVLDEPCCPHCR